MAIERQGVVYDGPGGTFEGMSVRDTAAGSRPGVMIVPNVLGTKEADFVTAEKLAGLGYAAFVADVYGQGQRTTHASPDAMVHMNEMLGNPRLLRDRLHHSLAVLKQQPGVDAARTAAIGYCFGGRCVLDMARSGAGLLGVICFHGIYTRPDYDNVTPIRPKILVCHGWNDPLCPPDATVGLATELTAAGADWQMLAFGHTGHGFTDPTANMVDRGIAHQPDAARRSWLAMRNFLDEIFS